jgi:hypothetical protein
VAAQFSDIATQYGDAVAQFGDGDSAWQWRGSVWSWGDNILVQFFDDAAPLDDEVAHFGHVMAPFPYEFFLLVNAVAQFGRCNGPVC